MFQVAALCGGTLSIPREVTMSAAPIQPADDAYVRVWRAGEHIPQLDGMRGLAIALVTCYRFAKEFPTDSFVGGLLAPIFQLGDRGVDLFFVLSGFLITGILLKTREQGDYFRNFFARRSLRIFPLYFSSIALFLTIGYWAQPEAFTQAFSNQAYLWTYTTNIKMSLGNQWCFDSLDHFWSLAVEEHFYLVWPLVIWCCSLKLAMRLTLVLAIASSLSRIGFAMTSDNGVAPDVLTLFRCDALLMGAYLAMSIRLERGLESIVKWSPAIIAVGLGGGLFLSLIDKRLWTVPHTLWPLMWFGVLALLLNSRSNSWFAKAFALRPLKSLGKYSYAMYVFQNPLIPLTAGWISAQSLASWVGIDWLGHLFYVALMFGLTYGLALFSWYGFESHILKLKDYFADSNEHRSGERKATSAETERTGWAVVPPSGM